MTFASLEFLVFLPIVLLLYRIFPSKLRWFVLLVGSYVFCGLYDVAVLIAIVSVTLISYICARKIESAIETVVKKVYLGISVVASVAILFVYKYFGFFAEGFNGLTAAIGLGIPDLELDLIVPIGISFFTLRTIAYTVDVFRKKQLPEKHIGYYALYVSFFPTLLAGPIEEPSGLIEQLKAKKPFAGYDAAYGFKMLAVGFFKLVVASRLVSGYADTVFANTNTIDFNLMNGFTVLFGAIMFAVQIYCDFSGMCDIGTGCAALMGIKLFESYHAPYLANGVTDLHHRWNISVTNWFERYVYEPMGGKSSSGVKRFLKLGLVYLLAGLWYGSGVTFILFGLMHLVLRIIEEIIEKPNKEKKPEFINKKLYKFFKRIVLAVAVIVSLILLRSDDLKSFGILVTTLFTGWGGIDFIGSMNAIGVSVISLVTVIAAIYTVVTLDRQITLKRNELRYDEALRPERAHAYIVLCWAVAIAWLILLTAGAGGYEYFKF